MPFLFLLRIRYPRSKDLLGALNRFAFRRVVVVVVVVVVTTPTQLHVIEPVAKRHHMVSGTLALLYIGYPKKLRQHPILYLDVVGL